MSRSVTQYCRASRTNRAKLFSNFPHAYQSRVDQGGWWSQAGMETRGRRGARRTRATSQGIRWTMAWLGKGRWAGTPVIWLKKHLGQITLSKIPGRDAHCSVGAFAETGLPCRRSSRGMTLPAWTRPSIR